MSNNDLEKYYKVLEVDYDASDKEIIRAYNHLKHLYTSGSMATEPIDNEWDETDKQDILQKVQEAYEKLISLAPEDRKIEKVPVEEEIVEEEIREEDIIEEDTDEEVMDEEEIVEEEPGPVEAEPAGQPPVVEEYRHHEVPEVHIEFDDDVDAGAGPHHEEANQLSGILTEEEEEEVEEEEEEEEEEPILEPESEELVTEDVEEPEEVEDSVEAEEAEEAEVVEEDTLAEEFIEPGPVSGNTFREVRETRELSIQELSDSTQIPAEILEFIEREEFERLPDAGYLRWNVTTYAKTLSLDPKECADEYMKRYREWKKSSK